MPPLSLFEREVDQPESKIHLARAALLIAQEEYPQLDVSSYLGKIQTITESLQKRLQLRHPSSLRDSLKIIHGCFFDELGFGGNNQNYYDPRNSFLHEVLNRRMGIPISLSILYLEILRGLSIRAVGINFPGHFLVKIKGARELYVDPFNKGAFVEKKELQDLLTIALPEPELLSRARLAPARPRQILFRLLANLKAIYMAREDFPKALKVMEKMILVSPRAAATYRDRGVAHYLTREYEKALDDFSSYVKLDPKASDARRVEMQISLLQRVVYDLN